MALETSVTVTELHSLATHRTSDPRQEVLHGLTANQAHLSPKFLYDNVGSTLFTVITQLPEYYPTRMEAEILRGHARDIAHHTGVVNSLIDLGAGDCTKGETLLRTVCPLQYVPIDISADYMARAVRRLKLTYPHIEILPLAQDFTDDLYLPHQVVGHRRLFFFPGSSIGNFSPAAALDLLQRVGTLAEHDGSLLIGVDCPKPEAVLLAAYDDPLQVTAAFNRNILRCINRLIDSDFDISDWEHEARFNGAHSRVEMHLVARRDLTVHWPGGQRHFRAGESIHTENSYKYVPTRFESMLRRAGFRNVHCWTDPREWFAVYLASTRAEPAPAYRH